MRFSAAIQQIARLGQLPDKPFDASPAERARPHPEPEPTLPKDLPADLDQRVRLVGEW